MKTSYNYELIEDFLDGLLEAKTAAEVSHLIETDEDARAIANGILILKEHFGKDKDIESYLNDRLVVAQNEISKNIASKRASPFLKIAASIVFIVASGLALYQLTGSNLEDTIAAQLETPYESAVASRGSETTTPSLKGLEAYSNGRYEEAVNLLKSENSAQANFFSGLSLLYLDRDAEAIKYLKSSNLFNSRYEEQSRWYLSLAYLKSDRLDEGEKLLLRIKFTERHFKQNEANEILALLSD